MPENKDRLTLTVYVSPETLIALKEKKYKLCMAVEVNGKSTVVFQTVSKLLIHNEFEFEDRYRVFGTNTFKDGALVEASTRKVPILLGQEITLSPEGVLGPASGTMDSAKPFIVHNHYTEPIHLGIDALFGGEYSSIYVTEEAILRGDIVCLPARKLLIWFEQNLETNTMISHARITNCMRLDFSKTSHITVNYKAPKDAPADGIWSYGPLMVHGQTA
ncbi:hypothetical protein E1B28_010516 [Marasmius oreades]|uniref:Uncharacterized protein n=1 Tax=Marasmius oreades TaxID=181124 RepID=A0A9P7RXF3_9AGAR|nr:uncharacterized protein E1B28_010516 [Marasmius oreades]KAG7091485.1 hypothetical protein E1B28_010516 [Marasmius oreades]